MCYEITLNLWEFDISMTNWFSSSVTIWKWNWRDYVDVDICPTLYYKLEMCVENGGERNFSLK